MTQLGYEVIGMTLTGEEALQIVAERLLDVALMDIKLAGALYGPHWMTEKMAYCLRKMGGIAQIGRQGWSKLYAADDFTFNDE